MDANITESNTTAAVPIDPIHVAYASIGSLAVITNVIIFAVLFGNKKLTTQSAVVFGFACSHLLLACNLGISGVMRIVFRAVSKDPRTPVECIRYIYPLFYPLAFQSSALLLILTGIERLTAVAFPHWFRMWLSDKRSWSLVGLIFSSVFVSVGVASSLVSTLPPTTRSCGQPGVFGNPYTAFVRLASACGGVVAVMFTIAALVIGAKRIRKLPLASGEVGRMKKQLQITRAMLGVAFIDFCLVVIPNSISFTATNTGIVLPSWIGATQSNVAFCVNATSSIIPYLLFNNQFRTAAAKLIYGNAKLAGIKQMNAAMQTAPQLGTERVVVTAWAPGAQ